MVIPQITFYYFQIQRIRILNFIITAKLIIKPAMLGKIFKMLPKCLEMVITQTTFYYNLNPERIGVL